MLRSGYTAHVATNGYLLDEACADRLVACNLKRAQVTLDGPPEIHNRRRPLADGRGSFERILANLKSVAGKFTLNLRINVDEDNRHTILDLMDLLEAEGLRGRVIPYLGRASPTLRYVPMWPVPACLMQTLPFWSLRQKWNSSEGAWAVIVSSKAEVQTAWQIIPMPLSSPLRVGSSTAGTMWLIRGPRSGTS